MKETLNSAHGRSRKLRTENFFSFDRSRKENPQDGNGGDPSEEGRAIVLLRRMNNFACLIHLAAAVGVGAFWGLRGGGTPDTILTVNRNFVQVARENVNVVEIGGCLAGKHYASHNQLKFKSQQQCSNYTNDGVVTLSVQPYPKDAGTSVNIASLVVSFFALSFFFQLCVNWAGKGFRTHLYRDMFVGKEEDDPSQVLSINYLRYVEYSISASVMMVGIALVAGISDLELILCMAFLTWACMLCGCGAELFLQICRCRL